MRNKAPDDADVSSFAIHGLVAEPRTFTREDLEQLPQVTRTVTFITRPEPRTVTYTGPLLVDVVKAAGGVVEQKRLDRLHTYLLASSASGYEVVFSWGEIDTLFGDTQIMIAHMSGGEPLAPTEGMARLVVPNDHHGGRYVSQLADIGVFSASGLV